MPVWLGIDLGTHAVRAVAVHDDGVVVALHSVSIASRRSHGRHEQDPEDWWTAAVEALSAVLARTPSGITVGGVAVSGTSGSVVALGVDRAEPAVPLSAGIMYDDQRGASFVRDGDLAAMPDTWQRVGFVPTAASGLAKAAWLAREAELPAGWRLGHHIDLVTSRLIGRVAATDTSHALKSGADQFTGTWSDAVSERFEIPAEALPSLVRPGAVLGEVSSTAAGITGVPSGTPVIAGMTDGCAGQIAAGALAIGSWAAILGTTTVLKGALAEPLSDPTGVVYHHRGPDGSWWGGGASSAGSGALDAAFGERLDMLRSSIDPLTRPHHVRYPLAGVGERFPFRSSTASIDLTAAAAAADDGYLSLLHGVALHVRLCLDHIEALGGPPSSEPVRLVGGATQSPRNVSLFATALGRPVSVPTTSEGAVGMAVLAATIDGSALPDVADRMLGAVAEVDPLDALVPDFDEAYAGFRADLRERAWIR